MERVAVIAMAAVKSNEFLMQLYDIKRLVVSKLIFVP
jgi:hypothetical protein